MRSALEPGALEPCAHGLVEELEAGPGHEEAEDEGADVDEDGLARGGVGMEGGPGALEAEDDGVLHDVERIGDVAQQAEAVEDLVARLRREIIGCHW